MFIAMVSCFLILAAPLTIVDIREHRLPNGLVLALGMSLALCAVADALVTQELHLHQESMVLVLALVVVAAATSLFAQASIGMGDVKLLLALIPIFALVAMPLVVTALWFGSIAALITLVMRRMVWRTPLRSPIAFGPFLLLSAGLPLALRIVN
jgi:leader peptidase (prepilin peptidase)/N-methyltransferase